MNKSEINNYNMKKYYSIFSQLPDEDYENCVFYLKQQLE